jgi:hypothetical protein
VRECCTCLLKALRQGQSSTGLAHLRRDALAPWRTPSRKRRIFASRGVPSDQSVGSGKFSIIADTVVTTRRFIDGTVSGTHHLPVGSKSSGNLAFSCGGEPILSWAPL